MWISDEANVQNKLEVEFSFVLDVVTACGTNALIQCVLIKSETRLKKCLFRNENPFFSFTIKYLSNEGWM